MDPVRLQWPLIAVGVLSFVGLSYWLLLNGLWWLVAGFAAVSAHAGYVAWRDGLPLLPGGPRRAMPRRAS